MEQENNEKVSTFFSKEDIEFLKKINEGTKNLESVLNPRSSTDTKNINDSRVKERTK